ncbi:MAG: molybdenum cofactor biosynthesis protein B [Pseudomonadota bacterium]
MTATPKTVHVPKPREDGFVPLGLAILSVSDTRTLETDTSGSILAERAEGAGHVVRHRDVVTDDVEIIQARVREWAADPEIHAIVTTGGTGLTGRDVTPDAVAPLLDKVIDGFSVVFHTVSYQSVGLSTIQSRALAGISNRTYVFVLPGSSGAVKDGWDHAIGPQLDARNRPCNLVQIMPRLGEGQPAWTV